MVSSRPLNLNGQPSTHQESSEASNGDRFGSSHSGKYALVYWWSTTVYDGLRWSTMVYVMLSGVYRSAGLTPSMQSPQLLDCLLLGQGTRGFV